MILQQLAYKISLDAGGFLTGKRKVESEARGLTEQIEKHNKTAGKSFDNLTIGVQRFGSVGKNAFSQVQIGAAKFLGVALTLEGARRVFMSTTNTMISMGASSQYLGMSISSLDGWTKAAQSMGVAGESVKGVLGTLKAANIWKTSGLGGAPNASAMALMQLNPAIVDEADPGNALRMTAQALRKQPEARAQGLWSQIGGDPAMFNMMMRGDLNQLVSQYTNKSEKNDAMYKQALEVKKVLTDITTSVENITDRLTLAFGPKVIEGLQSLDDWISSNKGGILGFFSEMGEAAEKLSSAMGGIKNLLAAYAGYKVGGLPGAVTAIAASQGMRFADAAYSDEGVKEENPLLRGVYSGYRSANDTVNEAWSYLNYLSGEAASAIGGAASTVFGGGDAKASMMKPNIVNGASPELMDAIRMVESGGGKYLFSPAGAVGDYQLMPGTARDLGLQVGGGVDERLNSSKSRAASTKYMAQLLKRYNGNTTNALRAYNWGMGNMDKYLAGDIQNMPQETIDYPFKIAQHYKGLNSMAISKPVNGGYSSGDSTSITINEVNVNSNPATAQQLSEDIKAQVQRSRTNVVFNNGTRS